MSDWLKITAVFDTPPTDFSTFADAFDRFSCPGSIVTDDPPAISAYLGDVPGAEQIAAKLKNELLSLGAHSVDVAREPDVDWSEHWKQFFKPMRLGKRLVVRPTWEDYATQPGDVELVIDPGQAFGTGDHPTTRLCLRLIDGMDWAGKQVADVGCGSGILGIAALKLGASSVLGTDIDPLSIEVSKRNADLNKVGGQWVVGDGFEPLEGFYDVVFSNIISAVLIRLAPDAARFVQPEGIWLVSGVIESNWPDVLGAAEKAGFELVEKIQEDDWLAAKFRRL